MSDNIITAKEKVMTDMNHMKKFQNECNRIKGVSAGFVDAMGNEYIVVMTKSQRREDLKYIRVNFQQMDFARVYPCEVVLKPERIDNLIKAASSLCAVTNSKPELTALIKAISDMGN